MQSSRPLPRDEWPQGMILHFDDFDTTAGPLLYVREAFRLQTTPEIPESVVPVIPEVSDTDNPGPDVVDRWAELWRDHWQYKDWFAEQLAEMTSTRFLEIQASRIPLRESALSLGVDREKLDIWLLALEGERQKRIVDRRRYQVGGYELNLRSQPVLPHLVAAWRQGLKTVSEVPVTGHFSHRATSSRLLVSPTTLNDPQSFASALTKFVTT